MPNLQAQRAKDFMIYEKSNVSMLYSLITSNGHLIKITSSQRQDLSCLWCPWMGNIRESQMWSK